MKITLTFLRVLASTVAVLVMGAGFGFANEDKADRQTQAALRMDAHPGAGKVQFERSCARCHGQKGEGDDARLVPGLAGQRFAYLVRQMANFGSAERDNAAMHHTMTEPGLANPQEWNNIAAYLNQLPATVIVETSAGSAVALGRGMFHEQCATCHKDDATGDKDGFVPSLRNLHYRYLISQLHKLADGHRHNLDPSVELFLRSFDEADMAALAAYLSRQQGVAGSPDHMLGNGVVVN